MAIVLVVLLALVGVLGGLGGPALPASAHDSLTGSTPADGSTVELPPASVDLTFSEPPLAIGAEVRVTGPDGAVVDAGDLTITGTTVSQPLAAELPAGAYAVVWRVTSGDGHPISGELGFTAAEGSTSAPSPTTTGTGEPTEDPTTAPTTEPTAEPTSDVTEPPQAAQGGDPGAGADADGDGSSAGPWALGAVVLAAVAVAVGWAARRRAAAGTQD